MVTVPEKFKKILTENNLYSEQISIRMNSLKPEEAIGYPKRDDYPLLQGKEVLVQADFKGSKGQAFTDEPFDFSGSIKEITELKLDTNRERALFVSSLNTVLRNLTLIDGTIHCKDNEPEECASKLANHLYEKFGKVKITLVGMQPGFAEALINKFSSKYIEILDLNPKNFGKDFNGITIKDSSYFSKQILPNSELTLATGSSVVNNTIDEIIKYSKNVIFYGTTIAGVAKLLNLQRLCFKSH